jgi:uncharacterized membrane protein YdjX (TVP38/TMEM64 family)
MGNGEHGSGRGPMSPAGDPASAAPGADTGTMEMPRERSVRVVLVILVLAAALVLVYVTPLRRVLTEAGQLSSWLRGLGWAAPAIFLAAATGLIAIGCPRLLFCPIAGVAFGFLPGLFWAQLAALLGSYATFLFVRWAGRDWVMGRWPRLRRHSQWIAGRGSLSVLLIRQIPMGGIWINALLGLSHVRHRGFLVGTAIGTLPEAIPATLLGAGVAQMSVGKGVACIVAASIWFVIVWQLFRWLRRRSNGADAVREDGGWDAVP